MQLQHVADDAEAVEIATQRWCPGIFIVTDQLTESKFFMVITKQVYPMSQSHRRRMYLTGCINTLPPNNMK